MPIFQRDGASLHYEVHGDGFPLLLIAPGGMRSAISYWESTPWNPIAQLSPTYSVIAMDQRNAGRSTAPVSGEDGWHTYIADQLALMDHVGADRFHTAGMCIGGPYCMGQIAAAPERVAGAVLFQPIGLDDNRHAFYAMFDDWANELRASSHADVPDEDWASFRSNMYDGDKVLFNLDVDFIRACHTPLLLLAGNDLYHPASTSRVIADEAPNVETLMSWKEGADREAAMRKVARVPGAELAGCEGGSGATGKESGQRDKRTQDSGGLFRTDRPLRSSDS